MADENFFDDVFGDPAEDPLLQGGKPETREPRSKDSENDEPEDSSRPSWTREAQRTPGASESSQNPASNPASSAKSQAEGQEEEGPPSEKTVAVEVGTKNGLQEVNRHLKRGWRLIYVCLDERSSSGEVGRPEELSQPSRTVLMTLRREQASTLFDFG
jgi:hypothetical protein